MPETGVLAHYDAMCRAIAEAHAVDEIKQIRDQATALEHDARLAHNVEAERQCCKIRLRAERRWGDLYKKQEKAEGQGERQADRTSPAVGRQDHWIANSGRDGRLEAAIL